MSDPRTLVEHFFRHEYGRLVAVLTRSLGIQNLDLAEDVVQSAISKAIQSWSYRGLPDSPAAWLYRTARHLAIDTLRRRQIESRSLQSIYSASLSTELDAIGEWPDDANDETLRLLFLCCHPQISLESSVALSLKMVSGFSTNEIACALMISHANAEKRITRAKEKLREIGTEITHLDLSVMEARIEPVQATIYLLFNEGYASSSGERTLRADLCEEAIRLAKMLIRSMPSSLASTSALLALMLMHSARFDSRIDQNGSLVLLEDQDRSKWDWERIREAMRWMESSASGSVLSRYHLDSAIAWEHCRAANFSEIDWLKISEYYARLEQLVSSPMIQLNLAIALSYSRGPDIGLSKLSQIPSDQRKRIRPWWDCAMADVYYRLGQSQHALAHWQDAVQLAINSDQIELILKRINKVKEASADLQRKPL